MKTSMPCKTCCLLMLETHSSARLVVYCGCCRLVCKCCWRWLRLMCRRWVVKTSMPCKTCCGCSTVRNLSTSEMTAIRYLALSSLTLAVDVPYARWFEDFIMMTTVTAECTAVGLRHAWVIPDSHYRLPASLCCLSVWVSREKRTCV